MNKHAQALGRKGGAVRSAAKTEAARANGQKGGRPPLPRNVNTTGLKTLDRLGADPRVQEIYRDEDGIWLYTADGFRSRYDDNHTIHEDTAREIIARAAGIETCPCDECGRALLARAELRRLTTKEKPDDQ